MESDPLPPPPGETRIEAVDGSRRDAPWAELVREGRAEGHAFLARLDAEWRSAANRFDAPGEALFVARAGEAVIAVCGLNVDPFQSDPRVARLRHLYVRPAARRRGVASRLVRHVLEHARVHAFFRVRLRTSDRDAARFYEALGFTPCSEEAATHHVRLA